MSRTSLPPRSPVAPVAAIARALPSRMPQPGRLLPLSALTVLAVAGLALASPVRAQESKANPRDPVPSATPAGKPTSCLLLNRIRSSEVRSDSVIDFIMRDGTVYRNTLPISCPSLGFERRFAYRTSTQQLCSIDMIQVLNMPRPQRGPTCGLGEFQPVTLDKTSKSTRKSK